MIGRLARRWKDLQGISKRTRRARLKGWRPWAPNALSAHLFLAPLAKPCGAPGCLKPNTGEELRGRQGFYYCDE